MRSHLAKIVVQYVTFLSRRSVNVKIALYFPYKSIPQGGARSLSACEVKNIIPGGLVVGNRDRSSNRVGDKDILFYLYFGRGCGVEGFFKCTKGEDWGVSG